MSNQKVAFITSIIGQDGFCLTESLLEKGYLVHYIKPCSSAFNAVRVDHFSL